MIFLIFLNLTSRVLVSVHFPFSRDCALTAGLSPACSESAWTKGGGLLHHSPSFPFLRAASTFPYGASRGRDPATQQTLIDCDSSVQGKRSCQALEPNSSSGAQKLSFPGSCSPNFRLAILHVAAHTDQPIVNQGPRPQPRTPSAGHRLFRKRSTFAKLRRRCEPFGCNCEE